MKINDIMVVATVNWKIIIEIKEVTDTKILALVLYDNEADGLCWQGQTISFSKKELEQFNRAEKLTKGQMLLEMLE